ncbi:HAMP domain-containing histidine kinase [Altererythrobacter sp. TH136]|nr:HAMP domain-containing histidine kinase [Altererythrobacter sp. TH136]
MHFDDRLATVLRHRATGERAAMTQFRQLLDLLGNRRAGRDESMLAAAWLRLAALGETIAADQRAMMIREPGLRFRNPELALHLAEDEPEVAAAALSVAQLSVHDWDALIPRLPIRARGFLRLRRDLPQATQHVLDRLGIRDRGLPSPYPAMDAAPAAPLPPLRPVPANDLAESDDDSASEIGALVRRIETFRKTRAARPPEEAPRLPLNERPDQARSRCEGFAFTTDAEGRIDWADAPIAPMVMGALVPVAADSGRNQHQPLRRVAMTWSGAPAVAGDWLIDAGPRFSDPGGRFMGYAGRFRRPALAAAAAASSPQADRMRQLLHELKTPVNAIQGFAEVIQQQLFGPTPHEYRALAATIAGDAARMLAGFDELDRLARLESGTLSLDEGSSDFAQTLQGLTVQLGEVLRSRNAQFLSEIDGAAGAVPLARHDAEALAWRLLATATGATGPGEVIALRLSRLANGVQLRIALPASLATQDDVFAADYRAGSGAVSAGMFGAGFALRLARAEAQAAGGDLVAANKALILTLPGLTAAEGQLSHDRAGAAHG